jgi:hypothetical protein
MNQETIEKIQKELKELYIELEDNQLLNKYYSKVPKEWKEDLEKLINIKTRLLKIGELTKNIKIL